MAASLGARIKAKALVADRVRLEPLTT
jgi:hypothetical protein